MIVCYVLFYVPLWVNFVVSNRKSENNLRRLKRIHEVGVEGFVLVERLPNSGPFPLSEKIWISVACTTFTLSLSKIKYSWHLKQDITKKAPT